MPWEITGNFCQYFEVQKSRLWGVERGKIRYLMAWKKKLPIELELSLRHFVTKVPVWWVWNICFHACFLCKESSVMWRSEFLALWEKSWYHSFSIMMPLIATILLVISVAVGNVFMTSYLEYSVTIKYVRSIEYIFLRLFWCWFYKGSIEVLP